MHVLSLPPAFVLSQDQTLMFNKTLIWLYWSRMNRREHSHLDAEERTLRILVDFILTKRDPPKSRSDPPFLSKRPRSSRTLPPTFLFLQSSVFKEQTSQTRCRGPIRFWLLARLSVAYAALLNFATTFAKLRSELPGRQQRCRCRC